MVDKIDFLRLMDELLEMDAGTLKGDEVLKDIELWDSVALISFMVMIKEHFNVMVAPKDVWACVTVNDLMSLATKSAAA